MDSTIPARLDVGHEASLGDTEFLPFSVLTFLRSLVTVQESPWSSLVFK